MSVTGSLAYSFICSTQFSLLARVNTHKHQDWINMNINMNIMVKIHLLNFLFPLHNSTVKELVKTWLYSGMKCTFVLPWKLDPRTSKDIVFLSIEFQNPATVLSWPFLWNPVWSKDFKINWPIIPLNTPYYNRVWKCNFCRQGYLPARGWIQKGNIHKYVRWEKTQFTGNAKHVLSITAKWYDSVVITDKIGF